MNFYPLRLLILLFVASGLGTVLAKAPDDPHSPVRMRFESDHPWRPPFGLERVGRPLGIIAEIDKCEQPSQQYVVVGLRDGKEILRHPLLLKGSHPYKQRITFDQWPTEVILLATAAPDGVGKEITRLLVPSPAFEADALARPDRIIHPVDLGTILVPADRLLLGKDQKTTVTVAAISRTQDVPGAKVSVWFAAAPNQKQTVKLPLAEGARQEASITISPPINTTARDVLHVTVADGEGSQLWQKEIPAMIVRNPPKWPTFGATETKLRYDAPISIRKEDGVWSSMPYEEGWKPEFKDVVVSLPNGERFVFWRGSGYTPFWVSRYNTALCYEWAETDPPPDGYTDCVEPLMDKELRYSRVEILESTASRVWVRWSYQACDFKYKVWGDSVVEDYYFYPDGFGTRVVTLKSTPGADYELSEFIIITSQGMYPLDVLPKNLVDILFIDGENREVLFPFLDNQQKEKRTPRDLPAIYRVRLHKDETSTAVSFSPTLTDLPPTFFPPFYDQGQLVTPCYWGSHWPLARGKTTGWKIDDRIHHSPSHNSVMSWCRKRPKPVSKEKLQTEDALGRQREMDVQTWVWLIGMSDCSNARLLEWAMSFAVPPSMEIKGGRLEGYVPARRACRIMVDSPNVTITIKPTEVWVNPVFELVGAPEKLISVRLNQRKLAAEQFAWDGHTLWLGTDIGNETSLQLDFAP